MGTAFRWNLASSWVAQLGDGIALAAGPLLVASLTRNPSLIAAAAMVQHVPTLLFGLYAGALADRVDRRRLVLAANLVRVVVLAVLVATIVSGQISIGVLLAVLFAVGLAEVFADSGFRAVLPMIVPKADLGIGNARHRGEGAGVTRDAARIGVVDRTGQPLAAAVVLVDRFRRVRERRVDRLHQRVLDGHGGEGIRIAAPLHAERM